LEAGSENVFHQIEKTVVEGAGAAGLAAVLAHPGLFAGRKVGIVLSGGNIDTRLLANVLLRDLARSGRLARLRLVLQDRPGSLMRVSKVFYNHNVNIIEIVHQRVFTHLPAKGLATDRVLLLHALKNAAVPIVTVIGIGVALLIGGAVVTESVFAIPGLGRLTVDAILRRDYPVIQGVVLLFSFMYVLVNLGVDLLYTVFDPRIRY